MKTIRLFLIALLIIGLVPFTPWASAAVADAPAVPGGVETRFARVGDIDVGYRVMGKGHPLLMITGYGATMDLWDPSIIRDLASRYRVILFDNRGMGSTTASDRPFTIGVFAEDTLGLLDALRIDKAHVLGWSMGTFIALELALKHPDRVSKLILYGGSCGWRGDGVVPAKPEVSAALMDLSGTDEERAGRLVGILFPEEWLKAHPDFLGGLPQPRTNISRASVARQGEAIETWKGVCRSLDRVVQPTLIITGTGDLVIPPANSLMMASKIPGSWLVRLPGGHSNMYQYPRVFSRSILAFLDGPED